MNVLIVFQDNILSLPYLDTDLLKTYKSQKEYASH